MPVDVQGFLAEQEAQSGDMEQTFEVADTGNNANQTAGTQGVANTGNAQNVIDLIEYGWEAEDFEFEEVGSTIEVSPDYSVESGQEVNQSASASD